MDYPYPVSTRPAWPVNASCAALVAALEGVEASGGGSAHLLAAAANVTQMALGYGAYAANDDDDGSGGGGCFPTLASGPGGIPGDGPGPDAWGYQSCTETLHEFSSRGALRTYAFDFDVSGTSPCAAVYGSAVSPDPRLLARR